MRTLFLVSMLVSLAACSSIPISTMLQYRNFDEQSFASLNPSQIRSKIRLSKPFTLNLEAIKLSLSVENEKGLRNFTFPLTLEKQEIIAEQQGFFSTSSAKTEYTFRLSEQAVESFSETQNLMAEDVKGNASFSIGAGFNEKLQEGQSVKLSILLLLDEEDGYFTLIEDAEVEFGKED